MTVRRVAAGYLISAACLATMLAGCATTPFGPTVQAMPGPGKTFDAFQSDNSSCKAFAGDQVRGQADASNQRTAGAVALTTLLGAGLGAAIGGSVGDAGSGAAVGAAAGAGTGTAIGAGNGANDQAMIQQQYDNAFSQCMFAKGEQVPGYAPNVMAGPGPAADPLVRSSQAELIRLGYLHGTADGYIGPRTRGAISGFEQSHGLPVDGAPSPGLLARLQSTPNGAPAATASASASAPSNWVAPAGSASATQAPAPSNWVTPAGSPSATPASATAPAASSNWVAPTKQ
jgi:Putative peptidoglycan binding domain